MNNRQSLIQAALEAFAENLSREFNDFQKDSIRLNKNLSLAKKNKDYNVVAILEEKLRLLNKANLDATRLITKIRTAISEKQLNENMYQVILDQYRNIVYNCFTSENAKDIFNTPVGVAQKKKKEIFNLSSVPATAKTINKLLITMDKVIHANEVLTGIKENNETQSPALIFTDSSKQTGKDLPEGGELSIQKPGISIKSIKGSDRPNNEDTASFFEPTNPAVKTEAGAKKLLAHGFDMVADRTREGVAGSTFTASLIHNNKIITANIGDSPAFLVKWNKQSRKVEVIQLTTEHNFNSSVEQEHLQNILRNKQPTEQTVILLKKDNKPGFQVNAAVVSLANLNVKNEIVVEADASNIPAIPLPVTVSRSFGDRLHAQAISTKPDFKTVSLEPTTDVDSFLIQSSDGLLLTEKEIADAVQEVLSTLKEDDDAAEKMMAHLVACNNKKLGEIRDDCTIVVVDLQKIDRTRPLVVTVADGHAYKSRMNGLQVLQKPPGYQGSAGSIMSSYVTRNFAAHLQDLPLNKPYPSVSRHFKLMALGVEKPVNKPGSVT